MSATRILGSAIASALLLAITPLAFAQDSASGDPPDRVMRLAYQSGDVEFAAAGEDDWGSVDINRPLTTGDQLETGDDGRAALELGDASVRIDGNSAFDLLDLEDDIAQFDLPQGTLNMSVRDMDSGESYEVDTPTIAFVADEPGIYRIDVAPDGDGSMVTVFSGSGTIYGEDGVNMPAEAGHSYRIGDSRLSDVTDGNLPAPDDFDRFCSARDERHARSESAEHVSDDMIGYDDLDGYGEWDSSSDDGDVWYPTQVPSDWAPYRDGRWEWIDPWGWTWVDHAPWGFAPSHYGRWAYIGHRWGWIPGGRSHGRHHGHSVYAPALVAFIGGSGFSIGIGGDQPVGWFPLGPRDVYQPPYRVSRDYFTSVNAGRFEPARVDNAFRTYSAHRQDPAIVYGNRNVKGAVTVVPRNVFTGARPVASATLRISQQDLAKANVEPLPRITPKAASLGVRAGATIAHGSGRQFARPIVARHVPPAATVPFSERVHAIAGQGGAPLAPAQLHEAHANGAQPAHVVIAAPHGDAANARVARPRADRAQAPTMPAGNRQTTNGNAPDAPSRPRMQQRMPRQQTAAVAPTPSTMPRAREQPRPIRAPMQPHDAQMQATPRVQPVPQPHPREAVPARQQETRDKAEQRRKDVQDQQQH